MPSKQELREIVDGFLELLELMKIGKAPPYTLPEKLSDLVDLTMRFPQIQQRFTRMDLEDRFSLGIEMYLKRDLDEKTRQDIKAYIKEIFEAEIFKYRFFFSVPELFEFPEGFKLGYGLLLPFQRLPADIRTYISTEWKFEYEKNTGHRTFKEYKKRKERELYLCLEVTSFTPEKATLLATEKANESLSVLKAVYGRHLSQLRECYYVVEGEKRFGRTKPEGFWPQRHWEYPRFDELISKINEIYSKNDPNEMQRRIKNSVSTYGMIEMATSLEIKFLLTVAAMEGLLISYEERDYIGWRFREKVALLLGDTIEWIAYFLHKDRKTIIDEDVNRNLVDSRIELSRRMANVYDKRSRFAHLSVEKKGLKGEITEEDFRFAEWIYKLLLARLLDLCSAEGLDKIEKTKENKSLNFYLEKIKFSARAV